jgi:aspartyl-tRNA synthetase
MKVTLNSIEVIADAIRILPIRVSDYEQHLLPTAMKDREGEGNSQWVVEMEQRLDNRVLDMRSTVNQAIFQLQAAVSDLFVKYMISNGFQWIHTPKLVHAATEGDLGFFEVDYFGRKAYLAQSPQFFKQTAIAMDMERVFEIGPLFRAEYSNSHRHMTEVKHSMMTK